MCVQTNIGMTENESTTRDEHSWWGGLQILPSSLSLGSCVERGVCSVFVNQCTAVC